MSFIEFVKTNLLSVIVITAIMVMTVGGTIMYIWMLRHYNQKYATGLVRVPVEILSALIVVVLIIGMLQSSLETKRQREQGLRNDLSNFTQRVIVDRWEKDSKSIPELTTMYDDIHFSYLSPPDKVIKERLKKAKIPYVTREDNPQAWHFAAQYIQELVNVVRKFGIEGRFPTNDEKALASINTTAYAGWFQCFRTYMATPTIRNVWERYKYRHVTPSFTAWVEYYIIEPISDSKFWSSHRKDWETKTKSFFLTDAEKSLKKAKKLYS